jgi:hypothetical protein
MVALLMVALVAQIDAPQAAGKVRETQAVVKIPDAHDAATWALQDCMLLPKSERLLTFYVWGGPAQTVRTAKINNLAVNSSLSQSAAMQYPALTADGRLFRYNLRHLCPKPEQLSRAIGVMNFLALNEPYWHISLEGLGRKPVACAPFLWIDGRTYTSTITVPSPTTAEPYSLLMAETGLLAPLLHHGDFLRRLSSTVEAEGGVYYHAIGFKRHRKSLNQTEIFATVGADTALSRKVEGDDRVGQVRSGVTGDPRAVEALQGAVGNVRITYDLNDGKTRGSVRQHPLYNLLSIVDKADGREIIFDRSNGLFAYILTDGAGKLIDVAPQALVTDHRVPEPHNANLFPPLSCVRCHASTGGVKPCPNDVPMLLNPRGGVDVFDDLKARSPDEAIDRLAGLYSGNFERRLTDARIKYGDAVFAATRGLTAEEAGIEWAKQYGDYTYELIDAQQQLLELGYKARSPQAAIPMLRKLLEPLATDSLLPNGQPFATDDPLIHAPSAGPRPISIPRYDMERTFAEQFRRVRARGVKNGLQEGRLELGP